MSEHIIARRTYLIIFAVLLVLTGTTIGLAYVPLGIWGTPVALAIAASKALLIVMFFMHLRYGTATARLAVAAGLFWFAIMLSGTLNDMLTRGWLPVPGK